MKILIDWLKDYIPLLTVPAYKLADDLTFRAVEVDEVVDITDKLQTIVLGHVLHMEKHPQADRLRVAKVSIGTKQLTIVCGAPNLYEGMFVAVAQPGSWVRESKTGEWVQLEAATIRGVASQGMVAGADEIGLAEGSAASSEHHIMDLSDVGTTAKLGKSIVQCVDVSPLLDVDVLANRPDLMSHLGLAREVAALHKLKLRIDAPTLPKARLKTAPLKIEVRAKKLIPRYTGIFISGVKQQASPLWLQQRLRRSGIRPINLVVDITNYIMLDMGQPLHAFDVDKINQKMVLREAKVGEKLRTLDGKEHALPEGALIIEDGKELIDLAGIMGGASSMITEQTCNVLLQAAIFDRHRIRSTARKLSHRTDAAARFEKGVAPAQTLLALQKAFALLKKYNPDLQLDFVVDQAQVKPTAERIVVRVQKMNSLLGTRISIAQARAVLVSLGFTISKQTSESLAVVPPLYRLDVHLEEDVIEEVGRVVGYNTIPSTPPGLVLDEVKTTQSILLRPIILSTLAAAGWQEVLQLSFTTKQLITQFGLDPKQHVPVLNPMSEEQAFLRSELLSSLLQLAERHLRVQDSVRIMEWAHVWVIAKGAQVEIPHLTGLTGPSANSFLEVKGAVEFLLKRLHIQDYAWSPVSAEHYLLLSHFHPDAVLVLQVGGELVGMIGQLRSRVTKTFGLDGQFSCFGLSYDQLIHVASSRYACQDIPQYPSIVLDIAVVVPEQVKWSEIRSVVMEHGGQYITAAEPFDVYTGDPIPTGKKNLAFRVTFQAADKTLLMEEAEQARTKIVTALGQRWGANLR